MSGVKLTVHHWKRKLKLGLVDLKFSDYFVLRTSSTTPGRDYKLFLAYSRLNVRKHFFQ